ncbi:alpha/beta fold hydrolase [Asanoa sp. NPDC050611]|uniref:alpha/beta fold hydrolase n=1 Tax=Asanoa sp. NPDC050611 TaxID=3157098 RepID=UPI0033D98DCA
MQWPSVASASEPADWMRENKTLGYYDMMSPREIFYSDLEAEAAAAAAADLGPQSVPSCSQTLTQAAWRTTVTTHIYGTRDPFVEVYRSFAERRADKVRTIDSGHSAFLSRPAELAAMLREELHEAASETT